MKHTKRRIECLSDLAKSGRIKGVVVAIDETEHWHEDIQRKANGPIYGIYFIDLTEPTHCCSITVDYPAYFVCNHFSNHSAWCDENGDLSQEGADELTELEWNSEDDEMSYFDSSSSFSILQVNRDSKKHIQELGGHDEWLERMRDYFRGNVPWAPWMSSNTNLNKNMLTYKELDKGEIAVFLSKKRTGTIKKVAGGFQYFAKGQKEGGDILSTVNAVKSTLEAQ